MGAVSAFLRQHNQQICDHWEARVKAEILGLQRLPRGVLVDYLPAFLDALADWVEGKTEDARRGFDALAEEHALERLRCGIDLSTVTREYAILRRAMLDELLHVELSFEARRDFILANEGMDVAINEAVRRYGVRRDEVHERFVGILGHDLRAPLSAMLIRVDQLLRAENLDAKQVHMLSRVRCTGERMERMIRDLMDFARGHLGGGIPAICSANDMGEMCRAAVEELNDLEPARDVQVRISGDLRGSWDRDRVVQAISNLVSNAMHHGQDPIVVDVREKGANAVVTEVSNGGVIAAELLPSIFEPFNRGADPSSPRHGLGLGLFIVRQIAHAHGGTCEVTSQEGSTSFSVTWPREPIEGVPT